MFDVREANFSVNRNDDQENVRYRVLAMILSSLPSETRFGSGRNNLDMKLFEVLRTEKHPIINNNFHFHPVYGDSREIYELLSSQRDFGRVIGLTNESAWFMYRITEKTHRIAQEIENLGLLDTDSISYLKSLGQKLLPCAA